MNERTLLADMPHHREIRAGGGRDFVAQIKPVVQLFRTQHGLLQHLHVIEGAERHVHCQSITGAEQVQHDMVHAHDSTVFAKCGQDFVRRHVVCRWEEFGDVDGVEMTPLRAPRRFLTGNDHGVAFLVPPFLAVQLVHDEHQIVHQLQIDADVEILGLEYLCQGVVVFPLEAIHMQMEVA